MSDIPFVFYLYVVYVKEINRMRINRLLVRVKQVQESIDSRIVTAPPSGGSEAAL